MMPIQKSSRPVALAFAAVVAVVTSAIVVNATTTITVPNAARYTYSLAAGAYGAAISPPAGVPVLVMGANTTIGYRGVGQVTMLRPSVAPYFLEWTGLESPTTVALPGLITSGWNAAAGTHILYLDYSHLVDIEVYTSTSFRVHNASGIAHTGVLTLFW